MLEAAQRSVGLDSNGPTIKVNDDESYSVWFGPKVPKGHEGNWIQTIPDKSYSVESVNNKGVSMNDLKTKIILVVTTITLIAGCAGLEKQSKPEVVPEIRPGILQGYLPVEVLPDSLALIPPAPMDDSTAIALDRDVSSQSLVLQGTARWNLAAQDADLHFPQAAGTFSCVLNAPITEQQTPHLYMLLRRTLADAGLASYTAKNHYNRTRPFVVNKEATCTPGDEEDLRKDGSYPSGHTAIGWAWALILAEISPEQTDAILARGWAFGQSRTICNVHWQSDVMMGRIVGAASVAKLHSNPDFLAAIEAAKNELKVVRAKELEPTRDCQAESEALKEYPSSAPWPANK
jgi:acid phosphatase (class A)